MITEKNFKNSIKTILNNGIIEGIPIKKKDFLQFLFEDKYLFHSFYNNFNRFYPEEYGKDMIFTKIQDFIYRLDLVISDWLIPIRHKETDLEIKYSIMDLINKDADFYSAVSYDNSDREILDEFENIYSERKDI